MPEFPDDIKYASTHEWARLESDGTVSVGITDHAQEELGDVVYVELPEVGQAVIAGGEAGVVESVKAASDIYAPVGGEVIAINEVLEDAPETVNDSPYENGWFFRIQPSDVGELDDLLDIEGYQAVCEQEAS
ncbi:MAG: glycine cleavage system protein H [Gammaproteobacteria bacterium]|nr:glycine cleavage system protein H [Gammaproteobacteria bacterium]MBS02547.1 glycine cleavage system protein H [Gammaproteobacteria bacterium]|tara:strand:+ start:570 stop:965 length:396 start_codon:yes stop_codon:yes gene_type:complete